MVGGRRGTGAARPSPIVTSECYVHALETATLLAWQPILDGPGFPGRTAISGRSFRRYGAGDETPALETTAGRVRPSETVFPKGHPSLDRESEVVRGTEQMDVIRHQQVIRHQPGCRHLPPDCVQSGLHRLICKPALSLFGADRQKDPIGPAKADFYTLGRSRTLRSEWRLVLQATQGKSRTLTGKAGSAAAPQRGPTAPCLSSPR